MSESKRSFWSSIPGFVTGLAGLLTAVVGLVTVLIQLDVIGGDDGDEAPTATTVAGGTQGAAGGGGAATSTTELGRLTVNPTLLKLQLNERDKNITVRNATATAVVTVLAPEFDGADKAVFRADAGCTNVRLEPNRTCTMKVLFTPSGTLKTYSAILVVKGDRGTPPVQVPIDATTIIP